MSCLNLEIAYAKVPGELLMEAWRDWDLALGSSERPPLPRLNLIMT